MDQNSNPIKQQKRELDKSKRKINREKQRLETQLKKMQKNIRDLAMKGKHNEAKLLARDIVRTSNQIKKLDEFSGNLNALSLKVGTLTSMNEIGKALENSSNAMNLVSNNLKKLLI